MKLKSLSLIAGAIALSLTTTSLAAKAETLSNSSLLVAQGQEQGPRQGKKGPWAELGLTDAQKTQIQQIQRETRTQIDNVLTQQQKDQLRAAFEARRAQREANQGQPGQRVGRRGDKGFAQLNLTEAQKTQMRQIRESSKQRIQAVLTPEQRTKLEQLRQDAQQRRQQRQQQQNP